MITLDGYAASHRAVDKLKTSGILPRRVRVRSCKYLNNVIEQDHRRIKQRIRPMLGFKRFEFIADLSHSDGHEKNQSPFAQCGHIATCH